MRWSQAGTLLVSVIAFVTIAISQSGCESGTPGSLPFCSTYEPVYTSPKDTEETRRQVDRNNAVYLDACEST